MKLKTLLQSALVLLVALLLIAPVACHREAQEAAQQYYCPMHPDYHADNPGDCPICGMRLVKMEKNGKREEKAAAPAPPNAIPEHAPIEVAGEGVRLAGVQTVVAARRPLTRTTRAAGVVTPDETRVRRVQTKISGWVEKLYVNSTGQLVRAGQPLLSLYSPELLASQEEFLRAREAAARFSQSSLPEVRRGGDDLLAAARRRLELFDVPPSTIARLEKTGTAQRTVTLTAPVSGYVSGKQIFEGQQVQPGMDLLTVTDLSRVWVEADFFEYESRDLRLGAKAFVALPYDPGNHLTGRVAFVYPTVDPQTRTLKARLEFSNPGLALKPGMYVDVIPDLETRDGIVIPDSAVIDTGVRQMVFVQKGETFEPRAVRVGERAGGEAVVLSGVTEGERVAVRANFLLDSESRLRAAIQALPAAPVGGGAP
ncbi:MAG TPA: efflux RND transporter periplasmic adaptor subunit [Thermoanaerobaculia bacterium]|jgi:RND family efflux transporter MFP subunit